MMNTYCSSGVQNTRFNLRIWLIRLHQSELLEMITSRSRFKSTSNRIRINQELFVWNDYVTFENECLNWVKGRYYYSFFNKIFYRIKKMITSRSRPNVWIESREASLFLFSPRSSLPAPPLPRPKRRAKQEWQLFRAKTNYNDRTDDDGQRKQRHQTSDMPLLSIVWSSLIVARYITAAQ